MLNLSNFTAVLIIYLLCTYSSIKTCSSMLRIECVVVDVDCSSVVVGKDRVSGAKMMRLFRGEGFCF